MRQNGDILLAYTSLQEAWNTAGEARSKEQVAYVRVIRQIILDLKESPSLCCDPMRGLRGYSDHKADKMAFRKYDPLSLAKSITPKKLAPIIFETCAIM